MGIFGTKTSGEQFGIGNGYLPGQFGVWAKWGGTSEILRVTLTCIHGKSGSLPPFSYSILPSHNAPFYQSLALPQSVLEILRGRSPQANNTFELVFLFDGGGIGSLLVNQESFLRAVHGKVRGTPFSRETIQPTISPDTEELKQLSLEQLKTRSDEIRKAEAQRIRLADEQRAKAAAEEAAKKKAEEAAKTAQAWTPAARAAPSGDPKTPTLPACKVVIFYGSSTGNTKSAAESLKDALGNVDYVKNITEITPADFSVPEVVILGIPTWHIGELQDDWAALLPLLEQVNPTLTGKKVAIFGLGDQKGYPDTYVDAMQMLWEPFEKRGAKLFGLWPTKGYEFKQSKALKEDKFLGLVIDVENQDHLSEGRIKAWAAQIKTELGI